ncbi:MAG: sporulation peptidase YabG [Bacilli bacterium]|nr:sporulation peptidase YabG [Bacilli bacterium]
MTFQIGDLVTRFSYNHDTVFKIIDIKEDCAILRGVHVRLIADSDTSDLKKYDGDELKIEEEDDEATRSIGFVRSDSDRYFYIPGKILHIDGDESYLNRSMKLYKKSNVLAFGIILKEVEIENNITSFLNKLNPDILVITGHDAYYRKNEGTNKSKYKNSDNFIKAVKKARKYEKAHDKLIIIAGACQSNYEEIIKAGANFASSPKRVNIHALDPAIVASSISLADKNESIDLVGILEKTKYKTEGMGGIKTMGMMYVGYPSADKS